MPRIYRVILPLVGFLIRSTLCPMLISNLNVCKPQSIGFYKSQQNEFMFKIIHSHNILETPDTFNSVNKVNFDNSKKYVVLTKQREKTDKKHVSGYNFE